jgi:hypothetical protein
MAHSMMWSHLMPLRRGSWGNRRLDSPSGVPSRNKNTHLLESHQYRYVVAGFLKPCQGRQKSGRNPVTRSTPACHPVIIQEDALHVKSG